MEFKSTLSFSTHLLSEAEKKNCNKTFSHIVSANACVYSPGFSTTKIAVNATIVINKLDIRSKRILNQRVHDITMMKACVFSS